MGPDDEITENAEPMRAVMREGVTVPVDDGRDITRNADAEFSNEHLSVRVQVNISHQGRVSLNNVLAATHNVLAGVLASLGHPPHEVHTILNTWHEERVQENRQAGEF